MIYETYCTIFEDETAKTWRAKTDELHCNELKSILLLLDNCHTLLTTKKLAEVILKLTKLTEIFGNNVFTKNSNKIIWMAHFSVIDNYTPNDWTDESM
jgi:hypothetical protein